MSRRLVIAAGGTGGHMFPAQALAEEMLARGWSVTLMTDDRGATHAGGFPAAVTRKVLRSASLARGGMLAKLAAPLQIGAGILGALAAFLRDRPACVAGFGGYPAIPAMAAAWLLRLPRLIHEQNGVLGRVNRLFAPRVSAVACGTWPTELPGGIEGHPTGNPLRAAIRAVAASPYPAMEGPLTLLVFGGSQGASVMRAVPRAVGLLPDELHGRLHVVQQARDEDREDVAAAYRAQGIPAEIEPFFDDMPQRLRLAHLVICRSGASSVADIAAVGRPSILIPYPHATADHQTANARGLTRADAAVTLPETELTPETLSRHIAAILGDPTRARAMAAAAAALGRPDAAQALADLVQSLAQKEPT